MYIEPWVKPEAQSARVGRHVWSVARLITLAKDLPVMEVPLDHLSVWHKFQGLTLREMVMHIRAVMEADLSFPIMLDENGEILDGRHRVMKALYLDRKTILAVRFDKNPSPDRVEES